VSGHLRVFILASLFLHTAVPALYGAVDLVWVDNDGTNSGWLGARNATFTLTLNISSSEATTGLDYYLTTPDGFVGGTPYFTLNTTTPAGRDITGSSYSDTYFTNTQVQAVPANSLNPETDLDLGATLNNVNNENVPGTYLVAKYTFLVNNATPNGTYTIQTVSKPDTGWIGAGPDFNESPFNHHASYSITVATPQWNRDSSGNWSTVGNWSDNIAPGPSGATTAVANLYDRLVAPSTVTMDNNRFLNILNIESSISYTIARGASVTLTMNGANPSINIVKGSHIIAPFITWATSGSLNVSPNAALSASGTIIWNVGGAVNVSNNATLSTTGTMTWNGPGTININNTSMLSTTGTMNWNAAGTINVLAGGTLNMSGPLNWSANSTLNVAGTATISGTHTIGAGRTLTRTGGGLLTISGTQTTGAGAVLNLNGGNTNLNSSNGVAATFAVAASANLTLNVSGTGVVDLGADQNLKNLTISSATEAGNQGLDLNTPAAAGAFRSVRVYSTDLTAAKSALWAAVVNAAANPGDGIFDSGLATHVNSRLAIAQLPDLHGDQHVLLRPTIAGDLNLDGTVTISDFIDLASHFSATGITWQEGDVNADGTVTIADFIDLAANFGGTYTGEVFPISPEDSAKLAEFAAAHGVSVPEPGLIGLVGIGILISSRRRIHPRKRS
jgi:hypothetical protein